MSTQTDVRPETKDTETGPEMFHYVDKDKMVDSAVNGTWVIAICGQTFPVTKVPKPGSPVCPKCEEIFKTLQP